MAGARALRVVDDFGPRYASEGDVEDFAATLSDAYLQCRELGHNWRPHTAGRYKDGGFRRTLRCPRCRTKKHQELSSRGQIMGSTHYTHPDGYLTHGMGRIVGEGRDILRLASIMRLEPDEIAEDD